MTAGDWIWAHEDEEYTYKVGDVGAVIFTQWPSTTLDGLPTYDGDDFKNIISCSTDEKVLKVMSINKNSLPQYSEGDHKFLPFTPTMPNKAERGRFFTWMSRIAPNTSIPNHSHPLEKLADIKIIVEGSVKIDGKELTAGNWFWVPEGENYSFSTGKLGATLISGWPWN